jgi:hypothetical protein
VLEREQWRDWALGHPVAASLVAGAASAVVILLLTTSYQDSFAVSLALVSAGFVGMWVLYYVVLRHERAKEVGSSRVHPLTEFGTTVASQSQCLVFAIGFAGFAALFAVFAGITSHGGGTSGVAVWLLLALGSAVMGGVWLQRWIERR